MHTSEVQRLFVFLRHSSFFAWVHHPAHGQRTLVRVCVCACVPLCALRSRGSENNVTPKGSHLSPFLPSSPMPPPEWAPAGISFRSSEEMSDLFHHRSHKDWTVASLPTSRKLQTLTLCLDIRSAVRAWENQKHSHMVLKTQHLYLEGLLLLGSFWWVKMQHKQQGELGTMFGKFSRTNWGH